MIQEFHNPEEVIVLVRDMEDPMAILKTSIPTSLSTKDGNYPTMVMIQMEKIKISLRGICTET